MADYREMYETMFRAATRAIKILQQAQLDCEEMYISVDDSDEWIPAQDDTDSQRYPDT